MLNDARTTDTQRELFSKIPNFWAWADKLGRTLLGHLGYLRPIYQYPFWYCLFTIMNTFPKGHLLILLSRLARES